MSESAVVGITDELTGQAVVAFVSLKDGYLADNAVEGDANHISPDNLRRELVLQVRGEIGPFAAPKSVIVVNDLPKTRSGKIMRRILRKISSNEADQLGDLSTLANPDVVPSIISAVENQFFNQQKK